MLDGERCVRCKEHFKFEQLEVGPDGFGICHACSEKIKGAEEPKRRCPVDDSEMEKAFLRNVVLIDRCPVCKGVWFDGDELEIVAQGIQAEGFARLMLISMTGAIC